MAYIIVKHAQDGAWEYYFDKDPKSEKIHKSYSAHLTYTGQKLGLKERYENIDKAIEDCKKINDINPVGQYAVCKLLED